MRSASGLFKGLAAVSFLALAVLLYLDTVYLPERKSMEEHHAAIAELAREVHSLHKDHKEHDTLKQQISALEAAVLQLYPKMILGSESGAGTSTTAPAGPRPSKEVKIRWRDDDKCGAEVLINGKMAECNPDSSFPCCSASGWCGASAEHCACAGCVDYRNVRNQQRAAAEVTAYREEKNKSIALVIPFRDRGVHLQRFRERMQLHADSWTARGIGHTWVVFVVEQFDSALFNRGWLFNVGYALSLEHTKKTGVAFDCVVMQDIDLLPETNVDYGWCIWPIQLSGEIECWSWSAPYPDNVGGVTSLSPKHWSAINGFSNEYEGWGGEDDDLYLRLKQNSLLKGNCHTWCKDAKKPTMPMVLRPPLGHGRFDCLHDGDHTPRQRAPNDAPMWARLNAMKANSQRWRSDGISSITFHTAGSPVLSRACEAGCHAEEDPVLKRRSFNEIWVRVSRRPISSPSRVTIKFDLAGVPCNQSDRPLSAVPAGLESLRKLLVESLSSSCSSQTAWVNRSSFLLVDVTQGQVLLIGEGIEPVVPDSSLPSIEVGSGDKEKTPQAASASPYLVQGQRLSRWLRKLPESHQGWLVADVRPAVQLYRSFVDAGRQVPQSAPVCISATSFEGKKKFRATPGTRWCGDGGWSHNDFFLALRSKSTVPREQLLPICISYNPKIYTYRFDLSEAGCVGHHKPSNTFWKHAQTIHTVKDAKGEQICVGFLSAGPSTRWMMLKTPRCDMNGFTHSFSFPAITDHFIPPLAPCCIIQTSLPDGEVLRRLALPAQCRGSLPADKGLPPWKYSQEMVLLARRHSHEDVQICTAEGLAEKSATDSDSNIGLLWRVFRGEACTKPKFATRENDRKVHWQVQQDPALYVPPRGTGAYLSLCMIPTKSAPGFRYTWLANECKIEGARKELSFHSISVTDALGYMHLIDDVI